MTNAEQFIGAYGPAWLTGVLIDHADAFVAQGGRIRTGRHAFWAVLPNGQACPVVCGDFVQIDTEDGPISGRCGCNVVPDLGACERHAEERQEWLAMSESERVMWEKSHDETP